MESLSSSFGRQMAPFVKEKPESDSEDDNNKQRFHSRTIAIGEKKPQYKN